jgi:hypothetical protein
MTTYTRFTYASLFPCGSALISFEKRGEGGARMNAWASRLALSRSAVLVFSIMLGCDIRYGAFLSTNVAREAHTA